MTRSKPQRGGEDLRVSSELATPRVAQGHNESIQDEQGGFRPGRGCPEQIFVLCEAVRQEAIHLIDPWETCYFFRYEHPFTFICIRIRSLLFFCLSFLSHFFLSLFSFSLLSLSLALSLSLWILRGV